MTIPTQQELDAAAEAIEIIIADLGSIKALIGVVRQGRFLCDGVSVPLAEEQLQPMIDEYAAAKARCVTWFQALP